jgi:membrane-associated protease RseP (regulator of RpoE activity)
VIAGVVPESPAEKAGLEEGDLIVSMDGRDVETVEQLMDRVRAKKVGDPSKFSVQREGKRRDVTVTLGSREVDDDTPAPDPRRAPRGPVPQAALGTGPSSSGRGRGLHLVRGRHPRPQAPSPDDAQIQPVLIRRSRIPGVTTMI